MDRYQINKMSDVEARSELVALAQAMLDGKLTFLEGSVRVVALKEQISNVADDDPDFLAFVLISSETDHLPLAAQRSLWSSEALARLEPEFKSVEDWARSFALEACKNFITRFKKFEVKARFELVALAQAMLDGKVTFFEGSKHMLALKEQISDLVDDDPDFLTFVVILSLAEKGSFQSTEVSMHLHSEFKSAEEWAKSFAPKACENLIVRFKKII